MKSIFTDKTKTPCDADLKIALGSTYVLWNKLREYIGIEWYSYDNESVECEVAGDILDKMQELQGSDE